MAEFHRRWRRGSRQPGSVPVANVSVATTGSAFPSGFIGMSPSLRRQPLRWCPARLLLGRHRDLICCRPFSHRRTQHHCSQPNCTVSRTPHQMLRDQFPCRMHFRLPGSRLPPDLLIHSRADPHQCSPGVEFGIALVSSAFFVYRRSVICLAQGISRQRVSVERSR